MSSKRPVAKPDRVVVDKILCVVGNKERTVRFFCADGYYQAPKEQSETTCIMVDFDQYLAYLSILQDIALTEELEALNAPRTAPEKNDTGEKFVQELLDADAQSPT